MYLRSFVLLAAMMILGIVQNDSSEPSTVIVSSYIKLAKAYEADDEGVIRSLIAPNFTFAYVPGTREDLANYLADWKAIKDSAADRDVSIKVLRLAVYGSIAEADIILTQTHSQMSNSHIDTSHEHDRWTLFGNTWMLQSSAIISTTTLENGEVVTRDGPAAIPNPSQRKAVVNQLRLDAWRIGSTIPTSTTEDLKPLAYAISNAPLVALGEATHGTSEFFSLKDRILRYLVEKMGFTVFAMETSWNSGLSIDRYLRTGRGDAHSVLETAFPVWQNHEVLELIKWMRAYNLTRGNRPELRFVGIDMQGDPGLVQHALLRFIRRARPNDFEIATGNIQCLKLVAPISAECAANIDTLRNVVNAAAVTSTLPREEILEAQHAADVAVQITHVLRSTDESDESNARDKAMAENVEWFSHTAFPRSRMVVWAHDVHVMASSTYGSVPMGSYLRSRYGSDYYAVGFAFDQGTVQPLGSNPPVTVAAEPTETIGGVFHAMGWPVFGLNMRPISPLTPLGAYISSAQPMRTIGAFVNADDLRPSQVYGLVALKKAFDSLIFVDSTHQSHSFWRTYRGDAP